MVFTGYCFDKKEDVEAVAEHQDGKTFQWCKAQASRLKCLIACGYVEKGNEDGVLYNSMMILSPEGELVYNARKVS